MQDLNDSIVENKDSEAPEKPQPKIETKPDSFKKKHHFRKEHAHKKVESEAQKEHSVKALVTKAAKASPDDDGDTNENDNNAVPQRKNRKGRHRGGHTGHQSRRHHRDSRYNIERHENPRAHEKDEADRYHDTGVPHDLENEIHRSTRGLEGDNFYRK